MKNKGLLLIIFILIACNSFSQYQSGFDSTTDLNTVDNIIKNLYDVISGPAGAQRSWSDFKNLFTTDARLYIAVPNKENGTMLKSITPQEYVQRNETRLSDIGFNETELYRITNTYGAGTQIFSTYESHFTNNNGEEEITRGINNIQLYYDGSRYYIATIFWDANAKNIQVPERYLPKR